MGIDIRDGAQLECINCGLCIDACDSVMDKIGLPRGLIAYDTEANITRRLAHEKPRFRFVRGRTVLYAGILVAVTGIMLLTLANRHTLDLDVMRDRNPDYVTLADGAVRNAYTLKLMNRFDAERPFVLAVSGIRARSINVIGLGQVGDKVPLRVEADKVRTIRLLVTVAKKDLPGSRRILFTFATGAESRSAEAVFVPGAPP
jgi:polyferredoxin